MAVAVAVPVTARVLLARLLFVAAAAVARLWLRIVSAMLPVLAFVVRGVVVGVIVFVMSGGMAHVHTQVTEEAAESYNLRELRGNAMRSRPHADMGEN